MVRKMLTVTTSSWRFDSTESKTSQHRARDHQLAGVSLQSSHVGDSVEGFMSYGLRLVLYLVGAGSLGFILAAMRKPFAWGVNLLFSIAGTYVVIIVGRRLFR